MAYTAPYIDATGIHIPTYSDIRDDLIEQMKVIFGDDIYIEEDSQDYQQISIMARKIYDANSLGILAYNNRTPITSIGVGLDNLCALVGITRKPAQYSIVQLTITGSPGTVINNGQASDGTHLWNLPEQVTIPESGIITVEATCNDPGQVLAPANSITTIATPLYGWTGVTNNYAVSGTNLGSDVESDADLRGRFAYSTLLPSQTVFEGMISAIQQTEGVVRVKGYENDTNSTSSEGFPAHSVTFVVEGGEDEEVAKAIYFKKTPGCYTNGTTTVNLTSDGGNITPIRFYRPTLKQIYLRVTITALSGYSEDYVTLIKSALINYINELQISDEVYRSVLISVVMSQLGSLATPAYTVTNVELSEDGTTYSTNDIQLDFNEVAYLEEANIEVVVN